MQFDWSTSGKPETRMFVELYHKPGSHDEAGAGVPTRLRVTVVGLS